MLQTINLNLTVSFRSKNNLTFKIQFRRYTIQVNSLCFIKKILDPTKSNQSNAKNI